MNHIYKLVPIAQNDIEITWKIYTDSKWGDEEKCPKETNKKTRNPPQIIKRNKWHESNLNTRGKV